MENHELIAEVKRLTAEITEQRGVISHVVNLLVNLSTAVDDGFKKVNERLAVLEGEKGMQGVNMQLGDIKNELHKIQKAYPYDELFNNMKSVTGEA